MNVLHVLSNHRWTERAEPATDLAIAQKDMGLHVHFVCGEKKGYPPGEAAVNHIRSKGVEADALEMEKHLRVRSALRNIPKLRAIIQERDIHVVHCHMPNAHLLSAIAVSKLAKKPLLVKSVYGPNGPEWKMRFRLLCASATDGLIVVCPEAVGRLPDRFKTGPQRVAVVPPGINLKRFADRSDVGRLQDVDLPKDSFVVGMVTAIGRRRRLDIVLGALKSLASRYPHLRLMIVGRGKIRRFVTEPAQRLGITDRIVMAGYCRDDKLVEAYHTMDVLAYPQPGTDKSCRTVREAMAAGLPVLASRVGVLPHLVEHGVAGWISDPDPDSMAEGLAWMIDHSEEMKRMSAAAVEAAKERFSRDNQARQILSFYHHLMHMQQGNSPLISSESQAR